VISNPKNKPYPVENVVTTSLTYEQQRAAKTLLSATELGSGQTCTSAARLEKIPKNSQPAGKWPKGLPTTLLCCLIDRTVL
jgi:hypothetical protein